MRVVLAEDSLLLREGLVLMAAGRTELDLHPSEDEHRRVMAVLAWLRGRPT